MAMSAFTKAVSAAYSADEKRLTVRYTGPLGVWYLSPKFTPVVFDRELNKAFKYDLDLEQKLTSTVLNYLEGETLNENEQSELNGRKYVLFDERYEFFFPVVETKYGWQQFPTGKSLEAQQQIKKA